jgi:hypothetical protein
MDGSIENACRTLDKAEEVLRRCELFFRHQGEMNAAAHLSDRVMYPPIHAAIQSVLQGISAFNATNEHHD